jgi:hypothetical protein
MTKTELFNRWQDVKLFTCDVDGEPTCPFTIVREMGTGVSFTDSRTNTDGSLVFPGEHFISVNKMEAEINFAASCAQASKALKALGPWPSWA